MDLTSLKNKKIILAGGSGFIGQYFVHTFSPVCRELLILTRQNEKEIENIKYVRWDARTIGPWTQELHDTDILINLTGKSIHSRFNQKNKSEILRSRVDSVKVLSEAIRLEKVFHLRWYQFTGAGIYNPVTDVAHDENSADLAHGFIGVVCKQWESAFASSSLPESQKICLRLSLVLGRGGGVYPILSNLAKFYLGGKQGSGNQYVSWIHIRDIASIIAFVESKQLHGTFNISAPAALKNLDWMKIFTKTNKAYFGMLAPAFLIKLSSLVTGIEPDLILNNMRVYPKRLLESGYTFEFPELISALESLAKK